MDARCKSFAAVTEHFIVLALCVDTYMCMILKVIGINEKNKTKQKSLTNKEHLNDHICERTIWLPNVK